MNEEERERLLVDLLQQGVSWYFAREAVASTELDRDQTFSLERQADLEVVADELRRLGYTVRAPLEEGDAWPAG